MVFELKPFASKGEVVFINGTWSLQPVQLFKLPNGKTIFRVGWTTFWFTEDGTFEGTECRYPTGDANKVSASQARDLISQLKTTRWRLPEIEYFERGTDEYKAERSSGTGRPVEI